MAHVGLPVRRTEDGWNVAMRRDVCFSPTCSTRIRRLDRAGRYPFCLTSTPAIRSHTFTKATVSSPSRPRLRAIV
ncbi:MAG TPA: hypothetical protein VEP50_00400 [bacterium]|nr:hypothetical protein [bacterium]